MAIKNKIVTLSTAQIRDLNSTPIEILPAPATGKTNILLAMSWHYDYVSTQFSANQDVRVKVEGTYNPDCAQSTFFTALASDSDAPFTNISKQSSKVRFMIYATANITSGDGSIDLYIQYEELTDEV